MAGISLNAQFELGAGVPIDSRFVLTKAQMLVINDNIMPDVYGAFCIDDKKFYIYDKNVAVPSAETGKFSVASGGVEDEEARNMAASALAMATEAISRVGGQKIQWYGTETAYQALPEETKDSDDIVFFTWNDTDGNYHYVLSDGSVNKIQYMSSASYDELENKEPNTAYLTPGGLYKGDINIGIGKTRLIVIGDSYGTTPENITYYYEVLRDKLHLTQGSSFYAACQGGAGFSNGNFLTRLKSLDSVIEEKGTVTDILVCGGWNDVVNGATQETFDEGISAFNTYARANYPNARINLAHISWGSQSKLDAGSSGWQVCELLPISLKRYLQAASDLGWRYLANTEYILHDYTDSLWSDGVHPSEAGNAILGEKLAVAFLAGSVDIYREETFTPVLIKGGQADSWIDNVNYPVYASAASSSDMIIKQHNGVTTVQIQVHDRSHSSIISCSNPGIMASMTLNCAKNVNQLFNIHASSKCIYGSINCNDVKTVMYNKASDYDDPSSKGTDFWYAPANISFYKGNMYLTIGATAVYPGNFETANLRYILIPNITLTFNTLDC